MVGVTPCSLSKAPAWGTFADLDLGDARLDNRARKIVEQFSAKPSTSVPQTCNGWSETIATYRFLENEAVEWRDIMAPHWAQTEKRMSEHPVAVANSSTQKTRVNLKRGEFTRGALSH